MEPAMTAPVLSNALHIGVTGTGVMARAGERPNDDPIRDLIRELLVAADLSWNEASRQVGKNTTYFYHYFERGTPKVLPDDVRSRLARLLNVPKGDLAPAPKPRPDLSARVLEFRRRGGLALADEGDLLHLLPAGTPHRPVGATAATETTARPPILAQVPAGFAVRVPDDSLRPRYAAGDLLYFHPGLPARLDDAVCIQRADGSRVVGVLRGLSDGVAIVTSLTPEDVAEIADIAAMAVEVGLRRDRAG
jgi:hypothetical protein